MHRSPSPRRTASGHVVALCWGYFALFAIVLLWTVIAPAFFRHDLQTASWPILIASITTLLGVDHLSGRRTISDLTRRLSEILRHK